MQSSQGRQIIRVPQQLEAKRQAQRKAEDIAVRRAEEQSKVSEAARREWEADKVKLSTGEYIAKEAFEQLTPAMQRLVAEGGLDAISTEGLSNDERFEKYKTFDLIPDDAILVRMVGDDFEYVAESEWLKLTPQMQQIAKTQGMGALSTEGLEDADLFNKYIEWGLVPADATLTSIENGKVTYTVPTDSTAAVPTYPLQGGLIQTPKRDDWSALAPSLQGAILDAWVKRQIETGRDDFTYDYNAETGELTIRDSTGKLMSIQDAEYAVRDNFGVGWAYDPEKNVLLTPKEVRKVENLYTRMTGVPDIPAEELELTLSAVPEGISYTPVKMDGTTIQYQVAEAHFVANANKQLKSVPYGQRSAVRQVIDKQWQELVDSGEVYKIGQQLIDRNPGAAEQKAVMKSIPVYGTIRYWNEMATWEKILSVGLDILTVAPMLKKAATVLSSATRTSPATLDAVLQSERALADNTVDYLRTLSNSDELIKTYNRLADVQEIYARNYSALRDATNLVDDIPVAFKADAEAHVQTLKGMVQNSADDLVSAVDDWAKLAQKTSGVDDPLQIARINDWSKTVVKHADEVVKSLETPAEQLKVLQSDLRAAQKALEEAQLQWPTNPNKWIDLMWDVKAADAKLTAATAGSYETVAKQLYATNEAARQMEDMLKMMSPDTIQYNSLSRAVREARVLSDELADKASNLLNSMEVEWGASMWSGESGGIGVPLEPSGGGVGIMSPTTSMATPLTGLPVSAEALIVAPVMPVTKGVVSLGAITLGIGEGLKVLEAAKPEYITFDAAAFRGAADAIATADLSNALTESVRRAVVDVVNLPDSSKLTAPQMNEVMRAAAFRALESDFEDVLLPEDAVQLKYELSEMLDNAISIVPTDVPQFSDVDIEVMTADKAASQLEPKLGIADLVKSETETQTKTATQAEVKPQTMQEVAITTKVKTGIAVPAATTIVPPPPPVPPAGDEEKDVDKDITRYPKGTIVWRQGYVWKIITPPYNDIKPKTVSRPPYGVMQRTGTPQQTLTFIGNKVPLKNVAFDLGIVDGFIDVVNRRIVFSGGGLDTDVGKRSPSKTVGMSVEKVEVLKRAELGIPNKRGTKSKKRSNLIPKTVVPQVLQVFD